MNKNDICYVCKKYFSLADSETIEMVNKKFRNGVDVERFEHILSAVLPFCENYIEKSDEKLKRKVGKVLLSKLDYSKFSPDEYVKCTYHRLYHLFQKTTGKGINPYKIIYCSVLTDAELKSARESGYKYTDDNSRDFNEIFFQLKHTLQTTDEEVVKLFEKCSTLIAKTYSFRIPRVLNQMCAFSIYSGRVFSVDECRDILKVNPSLFVVSSDRMDEAFRYIVKKVEPLVPNGRPKDMLLDIITTTRNWILNNSSLLTINASTMMSKEHYLKNNFKEQTHGAYVKEVEDIFKNPVNLYLINQIPLDVFKANALPNIRKLESVAKKEDVAKYIEKNPLVFGMPNAKFSKLIDQVTLISDLNPEEQYLDKFLALGKTIFAGSTDFSVDVVIDKLKNNNVIVELNVEEMEPQELLKTYVKVFCNDDMNVYDRIYDMLLKTKSEQALRDDLRKTRRELEELTSMLKRRDNLDESKDKILRLNTTVMNLNARRYEMYKPEKSVEEQEKREEINAIMTSLRDEYMQKSHKMGKRYQNADLLYEKTMDYLYKRFADHDVVTEYYKREIEGFFIDKTLKENFDVEEDIQLSFFGNDLTVKNVPAQLTKPLDDLSKEIKKTDEYTTTRIKFEKEK